MPLKETDKDTSAVELPRGYELEIYARVMPAVTCLAFDGGGALYAADVIGRVLAYRAGAFEVLAEGFIPPISGITFYDGSLYIAHKSRVSLVTRGGNKRDILLGLPSFGDYGNSKVVFSPNGRLFFGQGTATNSGVAGNDNAWLLEHPNFHDLPGADIHLNGANYASGDLFAPLSGLKAVTGAFQPYGAAAARGEVIKGGVKASGSILSCRPDGGGLELFAWGLRNISALKFDMSGRLFAVSLGMENRGSRPVVNSPAELHIIRRGMWYGWPDYTGGLPVSMPRFVPGDREYTRLLISDPPMLPPPPLYLFSPGTAVQSLDINYGRGFKYGSLYFAESGSSEIEDKKTGGCISAYDISNRAYSVFARNKDGAQDRGFGQLSDLVFGPDGALYVADGQVIWRISRNYKRSRQH
jgi:glucose/arabinose dehydrogenase